MSTFSKHLFAALMGALIFSSCSRPVAYFQPSQREQFTSPRTETAAVVTPAEIVQPATTVTESVVPAVTSPEATPAQQIAQANAAVEQIEAYVRNDSKLAADRKVSKRMNRFKQLLVTTTTKATVAPNATASPRKMTLLERTVLKKMDKKINRTLAPNKTQASSNTRLGAIIAVAGLLLILIGAVASSGSVVLIGLLGLIVGLVLVLIGLANNN